jgi:hypothetical protein
MLTLLFGAGKTGLANLPPANLMGWRLMISLAMLAPLARKWKDKRDAVALNDMGLR